MRMVERMMNNLTKNLNEMLYYDSEEFRKNAEYKEGERDGEKKKQIEIALKMLEEQEEIEKIILYTGLTEKEIEQLKNTKES